MLQVVSNRQNRSLQVDGSASANTPSNYSATDFLPTTDILQQYTLRPLECAKVYIDFRGLPSQMLYNQHFAIVVLDSAGKQQDLPYYFDPNVRILINANNASE